MLRSSSVKRAQPSSLKALSNPPFFFSPFSFPPFFLFFLSFPFLLFSHPPFLQHPDESCPEFLETRSEITGQAEYYLPRRANAFEAILSYSRGGSLCAPLDLCPTAWIEEVRACARARRHLRCPAASCASNRWLRLRDGSHLGELYSTSNPPPQNLFFLPPSPFSLLFFFFFFFLCTPPSSCNSTS